MQKKEPMRILHVVTHLRRGGIAEFLMNVYRRIDRTKIQFDFVKHTDYKEAHDIEISHLGGRVFTLPSHTGKNHFQYISAWRFLFQNHPEYRIVHGHNAMACFYLTIAKKYGCVTIMHSHATAFAPSFRGFVKHFLRYCVRARADYLFACSKKAGEFYFGKDAFRRYKYNVIRNTIDVQAFAYNRVIREKKRTELDIQEQLVLGHVGGYSYHKNHRFLIEIFAEVRRIRPDAMLILVGDGYLMEDIKRKVEHMGLSASVMFLSERPDVPDLLQSMDIFVFPSVHEGLPVAVIEAQAAGLPCIISDVISEEAHATKLIKAISLRCSVRVWASQIISHYESIERYDMSGIMKLAGYDVGRSVEWLTRFYEDTYVLTKRTGDGVR